MVSVAALRCSATISEEITADDKPFNYRKPPCSGSIQSPQADEVDVRYLGTGGVYVGWRGTGVLFGPFFSNPPLTSNLIGKYRHDRTRIEAHLEKVPLDTIRAIVTGHSHYDHFGDVPVVAGMACAAGIHVNAAGVAMLRGYPSLQKRVREVHEGDSFMVARAMRIRPVASDHAPQLCGLRRWPCELYVCEQPLWTTDFEQHSPRDFCRGNTFAYVIELLDADGRCVFRLYYNDSAPDAPLGIPAPEKYDLAILTIASFLHVRGYPEQLIAAIQPRHVLLTHYENFFSKNEGQWRFVTLLTPGRVRTFIDRMKLVGGDLQPEKPVCGAAGAGWTMPVPGEQARFRVK
jgi:L-ascorbate metabolism protein UlaG (beta-lactamase superfamily)